jgi:hypothetical protein
LFFSEGDERIVISGNSRRILVGYRPHFCNVGLGFFRNQTTRVVHSLDRVDRVTRKKDLNSTAACRVLMMHYARQMGVEQLQPTEHNNKHAVPILSFFGGGFESVGSPSA